MSRPLAVLFDFDGVIADTENVHIAAWERTFGLMGFDVSPEDCARAAEVDDRAFLAGVFLLKGIDDGDLDGWLARKQRTTLEMLTDFPRVYPGVAELVEALKGRARLGVVSTTWQENIVAVLRASGLAGAFELIVSKEDVPDLKPHPAAYTLAVARMALKPGRVAALEDSATGLTAARAAGLRCVAVGHRRAAGDWAAEATFLPAVADLPAALGALGFAEADRKPGRENSEKGGPGS